MIGRLDKLEIVRYDLFMLDPGVFQQVSDLQVLDLSDNLLTSLPSGLLDNLTNLVTLRIDNNNLAELPNTTFRGVSNLKTISLVGNNLVHIAEGVFAGLPLLTTLDLTDNDLVYVSDNALGPLFSDYLQLTEVRFSSNYLEEFPTWILAVRFLKLANLSHNSIQFSGIIRSLQRIDQAYIEMNIGQSPDNTDDKYRPDIARTINMEYNLIGTMDISALDEDTKLNVRLMLNFYQLDLNGNNLSCDCHIYPLYEYLRSMDTGAKRDYEEIGVLPYNFGSIRCSSPKMMSGQPLVTIDVDTFGCFGGVPDCPALCQCWLRSVDQAVVVLCDQRNLASLPKTLPTKSIKLDISGNYLSNLHVPLPQYMSSLTEVDLSSNQLSWINPRIFNQIDHNCTLKLRNNKLTHLPKQAS